MSTVVPVNFHLRHGDNIQLSGDHTCPTATRTKTYDNGLCFTNRPIRINEMVKAKVTQIDPKWKGKGCLGLTNQDPDTCDFDELMSPSDLAYSEKKYYTIHLKDIDYKVGTVFSWYRESIGDLKLKVDGGSKGEIVKEVRIAENLWAFIHLFGDMCGVTLRVEPQDDLDSSVSSKFPTTWAPIINDVHMYDVPYGTPEYRKIVDSFVRTGGPDAVKRIQRIQNPLLYESFVTHKSHMKGVNAPVERILYHGTRIDVVAKINAQGFNRSYCGYNATMYGNGTYFAVNANYSCQDKYSPMDGNNLRHVYQCKVLTGDFTMGRSGLLEPPAKSKAGTTLYDSVVDDIKKPNMFIIFRDDRAYPEYLISFKRQ